MLHSVLLALYVHAFCAYQDLETDIRSLLDQYDAAAKGPAKLAQLLLFLRVRVCARLRVSER